jgi:hypothetical protein
MTFFTNPVSQFPAETQDGQPLYDSYKNYAKREEAYRRQIEEARDEGLIIEFMVEAGYVNVGGPRQIDDEKREQKSNYFSESGR